MREQIEVLVEQLQPTMDQVARELFAFADFLEQLVREGAEET